MSDLPPPIPAATLVLMRPAADGPPQLLMTERASHMAFAAGAYVFPGGRIDPADHDTAAWLGETSADAAARVAAIRETIEETGIAPCVAPVLAADAIAAIRDGLGTGAPLHELLDEHGARLDLAALTPFARWCPNFKETRRFDTLFFLAAAPAGSAAALQVDAAEAVHAVWITAADILGEIAAGRVAAIFPTRRNLERLALFGSLDEAIADAARHPVERITPWVETRNGTPHLCIPEDAGYPVTSEPLATARRS